MFPKWVVTPFNLLRCLLLPALFISQSLTAHAQSATWTVDTNGNWSTGSNWSTGAAPGSTNSTTNSNTAIFPNMENGAGLTITINQTNLNIGSIDVTGSDNGYYFIGTTNGNPLLLSSGGSITMNGVDSGIYAPLILEPANSTSNGTYAFIAGSSEDGFGPVAGFEGNISGGTTTGTITLNLIAGSQGQVRINGNISNGGASSLGITVSGPGNVGLYGTNTYTGPTTVNSGVLQLEGSVSSASTLVVGGGTVNYEANGSSQTVNGLTINPGFSAVNAYVYTNETLNLGAITRNAGGMIDFNNGTGAGTPGSLYTTTTNTNGIIGPWAVYGSGTSMAYAVSGGTNSPISAYTGATTASSGTLYNVTNSNTNYTYAGSGSTAILINNITGNTLQVTGTGLTIANTGSSITLNGLMNSGTGNLVIGGTGNVIIGSNNELDVVTANNEIQISSVVTGTGSIVLASASPTNTGLGLYGNNTYSGGTVVTSGTLDIGASGTSPSNSAIGTGTLTLENGVYLANNSGSAVTLATDNTQIWNGSFSFTGSNALSFGSGNITLNASSVTISNLSSSSLTENGNIGGTGNLILNNSTIGSIFLTGNISNAGTITNMGLGSGTISGVIGPNVTGVIENGGNLILTGSNTYTSGTIIISGTLQVGNDGTTGNLGSGGVLDGGTLKYDRSNTLVESNAISGGGSVEQISSGTLILTGTNTFSGGLTINAGTVQVAGSGTLGSTTNAVTVDGTLDLNGTTQTIGALTGDFAILNSSNGTTSTLTIGNGITNTFENATYSGIIENNSGSGGTVALVKTGAGTEILTANNTYSGGTTINAGTLVVGDDTSTGSLGTGAIVDNGSLAYALSTNDTVGNSISGSGSVTQGYYSTLTLTGSNSYTGGTVLNGGELSLGSSGAIGTIGTITFNGGELQFSSSNTTDYSSRFSTTEDQIFAIDTNGQSITFASSLSSSGGELEKFGAGTLTLSVTNTYTGGTIVNDGTLQIIGSGTLGSTTGTLTLNAGILDLGGTTQTQGEVYFSGGTLQNGTLNAGSFSVTGTNAESANLGGSGALTVNNSSKLTFTGQGSYTGGTTIDATGILQVGSGGTIGSLGSGTITGVSGSSLIYDLTNSVTVTNVISGAMTLTQEGGGTLILTGSNTFSGQTSINAGAIDVENGSALGTSSTTVTNETALQLQGNITLSGGSQGISGSGISSNGAIENISGVNTISDYVYLNSSATIGSDAGTLIISEETLPSNSGSTTNLTLIGAGNGIITSDLLLFSGGLIKSGSGTWTLTGSSTFTGNTTINNGVLKVGLLAALGSAQPLGESSNVLFTGASASAPGILQYTGGTTTLYQNLTVSTGDYGTVNNSGGGVLDLSGNISKNGSVFTLAGGKFVVSGQITGSNSGSDLDLGSTSYGGAAQVALTTTNSYNGPTVITDGSYLLTTTNNALPTAPASNVTLGTNTDSGVINTLDLAGTSETVASLNVGSTSNNVINQVISSASTGSGTNLSISTSNSVTTGTLTVDYATTSTNDTFSGLLGGSGAATNFGLVKSGGGTLVLSGTNTYTGPTTINGGTLLVTGSTVSPTNTINSGGTLQGTGSVKGIIVNSGGNLTPGGAGFSPAETLAGTTNNILYATSLALNAGSSLTYNLYSSPVSPPLTQALGGNEINLSGGVLTLGSLGTGTNALTLNFNGSGTPGYGTLSNGQPAIYDLITDFSSTITAAQLNSDLSDGDIVLNNLDGLSGTNALSYADFSIVGSGGDLTLQLNLVPEPDTWVMFALGLGLLAFWGGRRRRGKFLSSRWDFSKMTPPTRH
ncbi:MAG: autotransporter-associated beta strand repeat-containing protein [Methylacidiphilales bacterium]|nr:autotransporter-associated beta strand repeat-containing protein [Candidatus Methylacidiphilales bacterium]